MDARAIMNKGMAVPRSCFSVVRKKFPVRPTKLIVIPHGGRSKKMGKGGTMAAVPKSCFGSARKKLLIRTKLPHSKNIIVIHNNTSITSNEEDVKTSCVEPGKDRISSVEKAPVVVVAASVERDQGVVKKVECGEVKEVRKLDEPPPPQKFVNGGDGESKGEVNNVVDRSKEVAEEGEEGEVEEEGTQINEKEEIMAGAVKIQSVFRGYLARRAFRALRSLVKLQAVVRGVCVRRQARIALRCMQTLLRLQLRVRERQQQQQLSKSNN